MWSKIQKFIFTKADPAPQSWPLDTQVSLFTEKMGKIKVF
jgi:hypothetical protein